MHVNGWGVGKPGDVQGCVDYLRDVDFYWNPHVDCVNTTGPFICEKGKAFINLSFYVSINHYFKNNHMR